VTDNDDPDQLAPQLDIQVDAPEPEVGVVALRGELDVATVPAFRAAISPLADDETVRLLVVDLVEVTFIDSTGLMTLLNALRRVMRREARMVLACSNPTVLRLFEATRTDATFEIVPTLEQALATDS
jgi:anti-sigma B factor antagonist